MPIDGESALFRRVAIIGFGLIGGSIARALRARPGLAGEIIACENAPAALERVVALGIADHATASAAMWLRPSRRISRQAPFCPMSDPPSNRCCAMWVR